MKGLPAAHPQPPRPLRRHHSPLTVVFLLVYFGMTSKQLLNWMNRRAATVKLGTGVLFLLLPAWLGYSLVSL
jgi:hypothetical protein